MREISFRGKRVDNGEWVEGFYYIATSGYAGSDEVIGKPCHMITTGRWEASGAYGERNELAEHKVIPETVGQYTGLTDKNGNKIFEGDIVEVTYLTSCYGNETEIREVTYNEEECCYYPMRWNETCEACDYFTEIQSIEVIGNIHDNPELLKGSDS